MNDSPTTLSSLAQAGPLQVYILYKYKKHENFIENTNTKTEMEMEMEIEKQFCAMLNADWSKPTMS